MNYMLKYILKCIQNKYKKNVWPILENAVQAYGLQVIADGKIDT